MARKPTVEQITSATPILVEALAQAAHCTPADAAEHLADVVDEGAHLGVPVSYFLDQYVSP